MTDTAVPRLHVLGDKSSTLATLVMTVRIVVVAVKSVVLTGDLNSIPQHLLTVVDGECHFADVRL